MDISKLGPEWVELPIAPSGIYALVWRRQIIYIGQSVDLWARIGVHQRRLIRWRKGIAPKVGEPPIIQFDQVFVFYCDKKELDRLEYQAIRRYRPSYNVKYNEGIIPLKFNLEDIGITPDQEVPIKRYRKPRFTAAQVRARKQAAEMQRGDNMKVTLPRMDYVARDQCTINLTRSERSSPNYLRR